MKVLILGSVGAWMGGYGVGARPPRDVDLMGSFEAFQLFYSKLEDPEKRARPLSGSKYHIVAGGVNYEFEIAHPDSTAESLLGELFGWEFDERPEVVELVAAPLDVAYTLKMSHRYLRNSPHFLKTMKDIRRMRKLGAKIPAGLEDWFKQREDATYYYNHPNLSQDKAGFFSGDGVDYVYDHDSIHETQAIFDRPAYTMYAEDGEEVKSSKEKFFALPEEIRLAGVYEEACVLALERHQIPNKFRPDQTSSFKIALEKVCTSITSGWFREYAWENYDKVMEIYLQRELKAEQQFVNMFRAGKSKLKPYKRR